MKPFQGNKTLSCCLEELAGCTLQKQLLRTTMHRSGRHYAQIKALDQSFPTVPRTSTFDKI
jgi:hypothetical protein